MPISAHSISRVISLCISIGCSLITLHYSLSTLASAVEYQKCPQGATCTIGEFLFDDEYVPISSASCNLTSRDPAGNLFVDNQSLTGTPDGWYAYTLNVTNQTTGLYRGHICCTVDGEDLCLDKSFTINVDSSSLTAQDIESAVWDATPAAHTNPNTFGSLIQNLSTLQASDVWNYSTRNLTGFGTLIADMWNYSSRSLTSFGSLITDIWDNDERSLTQTVTTDTSGLASKTDVTDIKKTIEGMKGTGLNYQDQELMLKIAAQVNENRDILDVLINQPIVQNFIEDGGEAPDLNAKLTKTRQVAELLFATTQQIVSRLGLITTKWDQLSATERKTELDSLITLLGDADKPDTFVSQTVWVDNAWGGNLGETLTNSATNLKTELLSARTQLNQDKTSAKTQLGQAVQTVTTLETTIGDVSNTPSDPTLFGKLKEMEALSSTLDTNDQALSQLLNTWNKTSAFKRSAKVKTVNSAVMATNRLSEADSLVLEASKDSPKPELNQVLSLKAVNDINRLLLASMKNQPVKGLWLTEGSIIFRTLITNPSERISQKVPLKYYLPAEIKKEDVITADEALNVSFDPDHNALMVTGDFELEPGETRTFAIRVNDIWIVKEAEIQSLAAQADELIKPLMKTSFYGQGATLKSDINVTLDKLSASLTDERTPDSRIRFYREAQIELAGVRAKLDGLKALVAQAGDSGSVIGAVNRTQGYIIGGIILVLLLGLAFLVYYIKLMRTTYSASLTERSTQVTNKYFPLTLPLGKGKFKPAYATVHPTPRQGGVGGGRRSPHSPAQVRATRFFQIMVIMLSTTILTLSALNIRSTRYSEPGSNAKVKGSSSEVKEVPSSEVEPGNKSPLTLSASPDNPLLILEKPYVGSAPVIYLNHETSANLGELENGFVHVTFTYDSVPVEGWLSLSSISP